MPDWADALIKIITFVLAFYGVMSAFAAKRAALAAETQAKHAGTQAKAAEEQAGLAAVQARAAERQVDIMLKTMAVDHIGTAIRYRRVMESIWSRVADARMAAGSRVDGNRRHQIVTAIEDCARQLEDMSPVFPPSVRADVANFLLRLGQQQGAIVLGAETPAEIAALRELHQRTLKAMQASIDAEIASLERKA